MFNALLRRYLDYIYFDMVDKRVAAQLRHVRKADVDVLLDLGCHNGINTARVREVLQPRVTIGLEYGPTAIVEAKERGVQTVRHDLNQPLPFDDAFADVVVAYDVLEHLVETWQAVCEVYRVLKPGGIFVIDCPNLAAWHNVLAL
ncbi:MAG: class I SAM-dependent methyltransferase, partial [Caldilineaceae bacterium]